MIFQQEPFSIHLNFHSKTAICDQIQAEILRLIQENKLRPGEALPTVRQVAAHLGVNFNTVARAYRALDLDGWIITRQGRGTYVSQPLESPALNHEKILLALSEHLQRAAEQLDLSRQEVLELLSGPAPVPGVKPARPLRKILRIQKRRRTGILWQHHQILRIAPKKTLRKARLPI